MWIELDASSGIPYLVVDSGVKIARDSLSMDAFASSADGRWTHYSLDQDAYNAAVP